MPENKSIKYTLLMTLPLLFVGCNETQKEPKTPKQPKPYENYYEFRSCGKGRCSIVQKVSGNEIIAKDIETGEFKKFKITPIGGETYNLHATRIRPEDLQYIYPNDTIGFASNSFKKYTNGTEFVSDNGTRDVSGVVIFNADSLRARKKRAFNQRMLNEISR